MTTSSETPNTLFTTSGKRKRSCDLRGSISRQAWNLVHCVAAVLRASPLDTLCSRKSVGPCEIHPCVLAVQASRKLHVYRLIQAEHSSYPGVTQLRI